MSSFMAFFLCFINFVCWHFTGPARAQAEKRASQDSEEAATLSYSGRIKIKVDSSFSITHCDIKKIHFNFLFRAALELKKERKQHRPRPEN